MNEIKEPPPFYSWEFHTSFFPALLRYLLRPKNRRYESTFANHITLELPAMAVISIILGIYGFSAVITSGSATGWGCGITGLSGFIYLLAGSIRSALGTRPSYNCFRTIVFLFFVFLGLTIGLATGYVYRSPYGLKFVFGFSGLILGYVVGIFGGLWVQYLGWIASLLDIIALAAIAGMVVLDIVLLL